MGRRALLAVATAVLLATSGCATLQSLGDGDGQSPPDVDVVDRYESLETVNATQYSSVDFGNSTNETRVAVLIDASSDPPRQYHRVLAPDSREGDATVVNETASLLYDASDNAVTRVPRADTGVTPRDRSEYFASIVAAARDDEVAKPRDDVSPLPVVPATSDAPSIPADAIDGFHVEYLGTRTVADRTAHGFELTATSEAALHVNQTLWLDDEYYYPLETHQVVEYDDRTIATTARLTDVTFNGDPPENAFEFDVPENASVETLDVGAETFDSVNALREDTNLSVPDPDVPDGYEFERAQLFGDNVTQVSLRYADGDDRVTVTKMDYVSNRSSAVTSGENVTVAGREGRYLTTGRTRLVTWTCEDSQYSVVATDLERDALLDVAESLGCE